jgi:hypothetical protein
MPEVCSVKLAAVPTLTDQLVSLGADPTSARYAAEQLAAGDARPLLLMLLGRGMLADVLPEHIGPGQPAWIERWRRLAEGGFPFIDVPALERLLAAGADASDLTDLVRSAQLLTAYNIANLIDDPGDAVPPGLDLPGEVVDWTLMHRDASGEMAEVGALHEEIMEWDRAGRGGAPRSLDLRKFQALPDDVRAEVRHLLRTREYAKAALLWQRHVGGEPAECLATAERLRGELARTHALGS